MNVNLENLEILKQNLRDLNLGVNVNFFQMSFKHNITMPNKYLLFVGRREGYKNFDNLIKALPRTITVSSNEITELFLISFASSLTPIILNGTDCKLKAKLKAIIWSSLDKHRWNYSEHIQH